MVRITKNSRSYDGGDAKVSLLGIPDAFVGSIDYKISQEHQLNHGLSRKPRSWSKGKETYSCTLEMMMEDVVAIQTANAGKRILDLDPFTIVIQYLPDNMVTLVPVQDEIFCKFQDSGRSISDEQGLKQSFEMFVLNITENVQII